MSRLRFLVAAVAVVLGAGLAVPVLATNRAVVPVVSVVVTLIVGWTFIATGLVAWRRRPASPVTTA